eukprot:2922313-Amphidinium_carterae.1
MTGRRHVTKTQTGTEPRYEAMYFVTRTTRATKIMHNLAKKGSRERVCQREQDQLYPLSMGESGCVTQLPTLLLTTLTTSSTARPKKKPCRKQGRKKATQQSLIEGFVDQVDLAIDSRRTTHHMPQ